MSEEQMNDSTFGRLFILMIVVMSLLAVVIMILASFAADDVNTRLDERSAIENSAAVQDRIAPVGALSDGSAIAPPVAAPVTLSGEQAYASCAACHASGIAGAPMVGDAAAWSSRISQGIDSLYEHAINGFQGNAGMMPAKGGNMALSDDSVKAAVDYMLEESK